MAKALFGNAQEYEEYTGENGIGVSWLFIFPIY